MVRVLLVGNGAREHAIAEALVNGGAELRAFMNKKNPGIASLAKDDFRVDDLENFEHASAFGKDCDFAVIGPEAPLVVGIANAFEAAGIPCVGPAIDAAQLEGSKIFTRSLLQKYNNPMNIEFATFTSMDDIPAYVDELGMENVVVKPDGLTGGKGVKVFGEHLHSMEDIDAYCQEIFSKGGRVVIEEKLDGEEFTLQTFVDGKTILATPLVQDHKRAFEGDEGPNTGGMGSYSMENHLMPFVSKDDVDVALANMQAAIDALKAETGTTYKGFLYGQFMKTKKGVKLVEFNVRFGDPEAINVLPIMTTSFVDICQGIINGTLCDLTAEFKNVATVVKYLVPAGYPDEPAANEPVIVDGKGMKKAGAKFYYASVNQKDDGSVLTSSSRTIGVLGIGPTIEKAEIIAEKGTAMVSGNLYHRADIGTKKLLQKRIDHMKKLK
ncbi:MAG TPA: phosphoribosylamine--glycine ligase [Candidatus Lokiarchaeia archaeon]|nr:phosphoribosylamine--glycine ligase [Candidatus Lokiarchaeia archaeon]